MWASLFFAFLSVPLQVWGPENLIGILFNAVGGSLLVIWVMIVLSEIKLRPALEARGKMSVRMWGYPFLPWLTVALLLGLTILMLWDPSARGQVITVAVAFAVLSALGYIVGKVNPAAQDHDEMTL